MKFNIPYELSQNNDFDLDTISSNNEVLSIAQIADEFHHCLNEVLEGYPEIREKARRLKNERTIKRRKASRAKR